MLPSAVRRVAVIGTGVIGASWIALFLAKGLQVVVTDPDPRAPARVSKFLDNVWPSLVKAGLAPGASLVNYRFVEEIDDYLADIDFIQENCPEDYTFKRKLLARLDRKTPPGTIICSSSPKPPSQLIGECNLHPGRILIGHPSSLPHLLPVIKVVPHPGTEVRHVITALHFYRSLGRTAILLRENSPALGGDRIQAALLSETYSLVERGVISANDIDVVMTGLQWAFAGPFQTNGQSIGKTSSDNELQSKHGSNQITAGYGARWV